jgi:hypothetical protein
MSKYHLSDFFRDARGVLNAFTLTALLAGFTLVTAPLVSRLMSWQPLGRDEMYTLSLLYCIAALGDAALGIFLNKMPGTLIQNTDGGDASLAAGPDATATTTPDVPPPNAAD